MVPMVSALFAALFYAVLLSGCLVIDTSDEPAAHHDCSLTLQTSGAVAGVVRNVDGCARSASISSWDGGQSVELTIGAHPREGRPFDYVELAFHELLGEAGEGTAVTVLLAIDQERRWRTPDGACTADYESEACSTPEVEDGVRYIIRALECTEPAEAESDEPVAIDQLSVTSTCEDRLELPRH